MPLLNESELLHRLPRWVTFPFGIPSPIWLKKRADIQGFVDQWGLKPVERESLPVMDDPHPLSNLSREALAELKYFRPRPFPGGLLLPHFHLKGEVYELTQEQWQKFSGEVLNDLKKRLAEAKNVNVPQLQQMDAMVDALNV